MVKRTLVVGALAVVFALGTLICSADEVLAQVRRPPRPAIRVPRPVKTPELTLVKPIVEDRIRLVMPDVRLLQRIRTGPDLVVSVRGPDRARAGDSIDLVVVVKNQGNATAPGSSSGGYMVDLVLSRDDEIPMEYAVWPGYAGATEHDFLEDMLLRGGRISNTNSLRAGASQTFRISVPIPRKTRMGIYYVGAVVDPGEKVKESNELNNIDTHKIKIAPWIWGRVVAPSGPWIMPYAVGNTTINDISPAGRTTYGDGLSGLLMTNAPFGGRLGFRHGYEDTLPSSSIKYYRWLYKQPGSTTWQEFTEAVGAHYVRDKGGQISYPVYSLGPQNVGGMNLYEFRPKDPPAEAGATTSWPAVDWFGDIYSGFLRTDELLNGVCQIKLEIYSPSGVQVIPGAGRFRFLVPNGVAGDGTVNTRPATSGEQQDGGFVFNVAVENRKCIAYIDLPAIGTTTAADICGFLLYSNRATEKVTLAFRAHHPSADAMFSFRLIRGVSIVPGTSAIGEVSAGAAGPYTGAGGIFSSDFAIPGLLGPQCPEKAAFSENLYVYAKATNGWHQRISGYDASHVRAFALAPK